MSARVYLIKTVDGGKDVSIMWMNSEDGQVYLVCIPYFSFSLSTIVRGQNKNKQIVNIADENLTDYAFLVGITILNQRII